MLSCDEWLCGLDKPPILVSLRLGYAPLTTNKGVCVKSAIVDDQGHRRPVVLTTDRNTDRKFAFLSQVSAPDYRPVDERDDAEAIRREQLARERLHERLAQRCAALVVPPHVIFAVLKAIVRRPDAC